MSHELKLILWFNKLSIWILLYNSTNFLNSKSPNLYKKFITFSKIGYEPIRNTDPHHTLKVHMAHIPFIYKYLINPYLPSMQFVSN